MHAHLDNHSADGNGGKQKGAGHCSCQGPELNCVLQEWPQHPVSQQLQRPHTYILRVGKKWCHDVCFIGEQSRPLNVLRQSLYAVTAVYPSIALARLSCAMVTMQLSAMLIACSCCSSIRGQTKVPTCMTRKLARSRRLIWEGGRKPLSWPRRPRGARDCPICSAMLRWNSHAAARHG